MKTFTIREAKTSLSKLIEKAYQGEEIVIARGPEPVVRLFPIADSKGRRQRCIARQIARGPKFFEPLSNEELAGGE
jgi:prevent-host-death family protein